MRATLTLLTASVAVGGTIPRGEWDGDISGMPNAKLPQSPLLGNGYTGIAIDYRSNQTANKIGPGNGGSVDFWVNTNTMWQCANATQPQAAFPPPRCQRIAFGGYSIRPFSSVSSFSAVEEIETATLHTNQSTASGILNTKTVMNPNEKGSFYTMMMSFGPSNECQDVNITVWVVSSTSIGSVSNVSFEDSILQMNRRSSSHEESSPYSVWTALALFLDVPTVGEPIIRRNATSSFDEVSAVVSVCPGKPVTLMFGLADNFNNESNTVTNSFDPSQAAVSAAKKASVASIQSASDSFWSSYWKVATLDTPDFPNLNKGWYFAQYFTHCALGRLGSPPSGLYGPWVSSDNPAWNGDYTLDYNQEAQYYGIFSSNRIDQFSSYGSPIFEWEPSARVQAQQEAQSAGIKCANNTLHFACHLAPWGYQSKDTNIYMHWNGMFAALPLISYWEYTRDEFDGKTYELLDGLNAWSHCFLEDINGQLVDFNRKNPDEEHEGQKVKNPQIGLSLIKRVAQVQLSMASYYNRTAPDYIIDIVNRLSPFNNDSNVWTSYKDASVRDSDNFAMYPLWPSQALQSTADPAVRNIARQSAKKYCDFASGRPVLVFSAAVRAGSDDEEGVYSKLDIVNGFESYYKKNGPSGLPTAPGGGTENVGVVAGLNDVFVQNPDFNYIEVFPVWPSNYTASFANLRTKGGYLISSGISNKYVSDITVTATVDTTPTVLLPWVDATVRCGGVVVNYTRVTPSGARGGIGASFNSPLGTRCVVSEK
eukprot:TRINITY_DN814_c0_g1_i3.p1 TRINITY_DN814_c0_g1~~TRINITY_DN814_c0_g1_i3.p1  ORF type:complete len:764 (+),score=169.98 TRINITY_DN814_c0_g1_i3:52-2343(+)